MTATRRHDLPEDLPPRLDFRVPPDRPGAARNYNELVALLVDLGKRIDKGGVTSKELLRWDEAVVPMLTRAESDALLSPDQEDDWPGTAEASERRWRNLRRILLRRKGVSA